MEHEHLFDPDDVKLLGKAISLFPNLQYAAFAAKHAERALNFPLETVEDLAPLFEIGDLPDVIARRKIMLDNARQYFPPQLFPIADSHDMIGKVLAALSWGDVNHYRERLCENSDSHFSRFAPSHARMGEN